MFGLISRFMTGFQKVSGSVVEGFLSSVYMAGGRMWVVFFNDCFIAVITLDMDCIDIRVFSVLEDVKVSV